MNLVWNSDVVEAYWNNHVSPPVGLTFCSAVRPSACRQNTFQYVTSPVFGESVSKLVNILPLAWCCVLCLCFLKFQNLVKVCRHLLWLNLAYAMSMLTHLPQCRIYASVNWVSIGSGNGICWLSVIYLLSHLTNPLWWHRYRQLCEEA